MRCVHLEVLAVQDEQPGRCVSIGKVCTFGGARSTRRTTRQCVSIGKVWTFGGARTQNEARSTVVLSV